MTATERAVRRNLQRRRLKALHHRTPGPAISPAS
jgi:RNase P protein component